MMNTWSTSIPLFKVAVLGTVSPYVTRVPALEAAPVLRLPLLLFDVFIFVVFFLLHPGRKNPFLSIIGKPEARYDVRNHHRGLVTVQHVWSFIWLFINASERATCVSSDNPSCNVRSSRRSCSTCRWGRARRLSAPSSQRSSPAERDVFNSKWSVFFILVTLCVGAKSDQRTTSVPGRG